MSVRMAPCDWPLDTSCCEGWEAFPQPVRDYATGIAVELLWRLSGLRFGLCPVTVRPCRRACDRVWAGWPPGGPSFWPVYTGGEWLNMGCGQCRSDCSCTELCEVVLRGPVDSVTEVRVDGVVVPPAGYEVMDFRKLVRTDGECWPDCQDLTAAPDQPGAFTVSYLQGIPVPAGGRAAAGAYACQVAKACTGGDCELPERVTSVTREGVQVALLDPQDFLDKGRTGILQVDQWLAGVNPYSKRQASRVFSPDVTPHRVVTWP